MKLPRISFDSPNDIVLSGQYQDDGAKVRYTIKKELCEFRILWKWMQTDLGFEKADIDKNVCEWLKEQEKIELEEFRKKSKVDHLRYFFKG